MARVSELFKELRELVEAGPFGFDMNVNYATKQYGLTESIAKSTVSYIEAEITEDKARDHWLDKQQGA